MAHVNGFLVIQAILGTICFMLHLFTLYDTHSVNEKSGETWLMGIGYGTYFLIITAQFIAVVSGDNFTPPMEALIKIYGGVIFNILGIYLIHAFAQEYHDVINKDNLGQKLEFIARTITKGVFSLLLSFFYYYECFRSGG